MKKFMDKDFLLETETAKVLYHDHAAKMPICDFHNHLNVQEIYEDKVFNDIGEIWLGGDHYKWRALRTNGIQEEYVTGKEVSFQEKFSKWAETIPYTFGNPLYHWTHLELQRYFEEPLSPKTEKEIYEKCNQMLNTKEFSVRNLLRMMNITVLCSTDDPADDLRYHKALKEDGFEIQVLPTFRPDKALGIDKADFAEYIAKLSEVVGYEIDSIETLKKALEERINYFAEVGCRVSDHGLDENLYIKASEEEVDAIFKKALAGEKLTAEEIKKFKGNVLVFLGSHYHKRNWTMQLHIGAVRNNSTRMFEKLGPDAGFDSIDDICYAKELSALLNAMDYNAELPKTILYCLNAKDNEMLASMAGNFQDGSCKGKVQFGAAWWFLDQKRGMEAQLDVLSQIGLIDAADCEASGAHSALAYEMLTDSRSFLSFPRHEYFRRILCNYIGNLVENGEYPADMEFLGQMVENICYNNAMEYFGF